MKQGQAHAISALSGRRLDASYFLSPGVSAAERLALLEHSGIETRLIGGPGGLGTIAATTRTKRLYAGADEPGTSYLRPYDVFDYLPQSADTLVTDELSSSLMPQVGDILQTCSGRNLGPLAYADRYIAKFALSDDMLRLRITDERLRMYALTFLTTPIGQSLLRRSKTGAVIDHLSGPDLAAVQLPILDDRTVDHVSGLMLRAVTARESARVTLDDLVAEYSASLPQLDRSSPLKSGWTQSSQALTGRLDSAFYDPSVARIRQALLAVGGVRCGDYADAIMPPRYVRVYVGKEHGRPVISGRQLGQTNPINLRYLAEHSIDASLYEVKEGWVVFGGEGRAEERLGIPSLVTKERASWLASEHVMRVVPKEGTHPGWLYLAFALGAVQAQVKSIPCGSVIDELQPFDLANVILPPPDIVRADIALNAWDLFDLANGLEEEAREAFNAGLAAAEEAS